MKLFFKFNAFLLCVLLSYVALVDCLTVVCSLYFAGQRSSFSPNSNNVSYLLPVM